ncbi:MAG: hypothetical protein OSJ35_08635, partial [Alistipes sp.]|nr:hypothetical protein [Alistipes sp.]
LNSITISFRISLFCSNFAYQIAESTNFNKKIFDSTFDEYFGHVAIGLPDCLHFEQLLLVSLQLPFCWYSWLVDLLLIFDRKLL